MLGVAVLARVGEVARDDGAEGGLMVPVADLIEEGRDERVAEVGNLRATGEAGDEGAEEIEDVRELGAVLIRGRRWMRAGEGMMGEVSAELSLECDPDFELISISSGVISSGSSASTVALASSASSSLPPSRPPISSSCSKTLPFNSASSLGMLSDSVDCIPMSMPAGTR